MDIKCEDLEAQALIKDIIEIRDKMETLSNIRIVKSITLHNIQSQCIHNIVDGNMKDGTPWHCSKCGANDLRLFKVGLEA